MAVAFPSASAVSLQAPDPSDPGASMQAPGNGAGDPFSAMLASASLAPAAVAGEQPDAALTTDDAASGWPDAAGDGLPSEQLLGLIAVPALPVLLNPVLDQSGAGQEPAAIVNPELAFALGEAAPWPLQGLAG
ncbi:MAG: hypothetical protein L6R48_15870, partial [Planctomycetes bacterium]|nr:hypothetical protein [Planctomycetota bacterium]